MPTLNFGAYQFCEADSHGQYVCREFVSVFNRGFFLTWNAVWRQLAAMPNTFYFIRLIHGVT
jgi:hypothetical protein